MSIKNLISTEEICTHYRVEQQFIHTLHQSEIIQIEIVEKKKYLPLSQMDIFEKMRRLHYEMGINMEGLEAVQTLLNRVEELQQEKRILENRLRLYE